MTATVPCMLRWRCRTLEDEWGYATALRLYAGSWIQRDPPNIIERYLNESLALASRSAPAHPQLIYP